MAATRRATAGRADAVRSRAQILSTAIDLLAREPSASMERLAATAGVHRATVYRHFPNRQVLVDAVVDHALEEGRAIVERVGASTPGPTAVRQLAEEAVGFGQRYSFLVGTTQLSAAGPDPIGLAALMARWQADGVLDDAVTADWLAFSFIALSEAIFLPGAVKGSASKAEVLGRTFLDGARSTSRTRRSTRSG